MSDLRSGGPARPRPRPMDGQRPPVPDRPRPESATDRPRPVVAARPRPDAGPLRIAIGMGAVAATSALVTALVAPSGAGATGGQAVTTVAAPAAPAPVVRHVTQYVKLAPGQTAPPQSVVRQAPAPKPRTVAITTRQSGAKP